MALLVTCSKGSKRLKSDALDQKFLTLVENRTLFVSTLTSLNEHDLWKQWAADTWSIGHHLVHLAMALRLIRRFEMLALPVQRFCIPFLQPQVRDRTDH